MISPRCEPDDKSGIVVTDRREESRGCRDQLEHSECGVESIAHVPGDGDLEAAEREEAKEHKLSRQAMVSG